jgi:8-oxo-dGTP pyrophosphatase MutT (NUDIX family)
MTSALPCQDQDLLIALRARFASRASFLWEDEWPVHAEQSSASVLIAIAPRAQGLSVLLTRRADHLYHHPGQISFPGGRVEDSDASPIQAALRESEEEIGLSAEQVEVLGSLPEYGTSSGFRVTPVVGLVSASFEPRLDAFEVAELFSVPLHFVLQTANYQRHRVQRDGSVRRFFAIPHAGRFVWGATAGMLAMLAAFMSSAEYPGKARRCGQTDVRASTAAQPESGVYSA